MIIDGVYIMEIKKIYQDFSVYQVKDYSLINLESEYCFIGKTDEENMKRMLIQSEKKNVL